MISELFTKEKEDNFTYKGRFSDLNGELFLYSTNGYVYGNIHLDSLSYQIEPLNKKYALLLRRDYSELSCPTEEENEDGEKSKSINNNQENMPAIKSSNPVIDVMVVFSNQAAAATTDMEALAEASIQSSNTTFSNSDAGVTFNLVHYQQISYSESGSVQTDHTRLVGTSDGYMDNIHSLRNHYGADVVMLIVSNDPLYCGTAGNIGVVSSQAFAVTVDDCSVGNYTFAHEVGHLAGARHDNDNGTYPFSYGHGYRYLPAYWRTVMAVRNYSGDPTNRIPYWSNPDKYYGGIAMGTSGWNDNARVWDIRAGTMAAFKTLIIPPPAPTNLTHTNPTGSFPSFSWTASSGASSYKIYRKCYYGYNGDCTSSYAEVGSAFGTNWTDYTVIQNSPGQQETYQYAVKAYDGTSTSNYSNSVSVQAQPSVFKVSMSGVPEHFDLDQNYSNPFNPSTTFRFDLPEASSVTIHIFNVMGQKVATIIDQQMEAGRYTQTFDASNLSSGFYFAQFEAIGNSGEIFSKSIKMQLIK